MVIELGRDGKHGFFQSNAVSTGEDGEDGGHHVLVARIRERLHQGNAIHERGSFVLDHHECFLDRFRASRFHREGEITVHAALQIVIDRTRQGSWKLGQLATFKGSRDSFDDQRAVFVAFGQRKQLCTGVIVLRTARHSPALREMVDAKGPCELEIPGGRLGKQSQQGGAIGLCFRFQGPPEHERNALVGRVIIARHHCADDGQGDISRETSGAGQQLRAHLQMSLLQGQLLQCGSNLCAHIASVASAAHQPAADIGIGMLQQINGELIINITKHLHREQSIQGVFVGH